MGRVFVHRPFTATVRESYFPADQLDEQLRRYHAAVGKSEEELLRIKRDLEESDPDKAAIIKAHLEILHDDAMSEEILDSIKKERCAPDWAVEKTYAEYIRMLDEVDDKLISERAADLRDVRARILRNWFNVADRSLANLSEPAIIAAHDLMPSDTATINRDMVLAIITEIGGTTSHTAIIAKGYKIPAVVGIAGLMDHVDDGFEVAVDAIEGRIVVNPPPETMAEFEKRHAEYLARAELVEKYIAAAPIMADGTRIDIGLNIGSADSSELNGEAYSDYVGLFRTEFLYMKEAELPDEEEQFSAYKNVLDLYNPRPVTIRTLDIGGDKSLECMQLPREDNPFLGNRALRLCFTRTDIFRTQLRALLRASIYGDLWLMLPMVGSMDDIRRARAAIDDVKRELAEEYVAFSETMKIGIMIEIPSIAVIADIAAREVDFASIGTNDLCQYLTAVDRLNPMVAGYYQCYHPAMFRMMDDIIAHFNRAGKPISVCGEMGGDVLAAAVLVGLGMRKLSMGIGSVAEVKYMLSKLSLDKARSLACRVKNLSTAAEVEECLRDGVPF